MTKVSALYVETDGCYFGLPNVDPWDKARDARRFGGPGPVVAHPPCERWGRYSEGGPSHHGRFRTGDDGGCFHAALAAVLEHGGVLEHPEASKAWDAYGIVKPPRSGGWVPQGDNVWTCCVYQAQYGHVAPKATWLLYSSPTGIAPFELRWGFEGSSLPAQSADRSAARSRGVRSANDAIERMGKRQRQATPEPFRDVLLKLARHAVSGSRVARQPRSNGSDPDAVEALVVVHPSSIEAYIDTLRGDGCDVALGEELLFNIALTVKGHNGPVIWIDQGWDGRYIRMLRREVAGVSMQEIRFDEDQASWSTLWPKLRRALRAAGASRALVAGLWWGENSGCAKHVFDWLVAQGIPAVPVEDAIGYEGDCEPMDSVGDDERDNGRTRWGTRGAGAVFYCPSTGRILLGLRSEHVMEPGTWGGFGGKIDDEDVDPLDAMLREVSEETEYDADDMLAAELIWVYEAPDFRYYNYLVVVRHEFDPVLNWENEEARWVDPRRLPKPLHYGMKALIPHLRAHLGL